MPALLIIPVSLAIAFGFILLAYLVGRALPERWLLVGPAQWLQAVLVGISIEVCILRLPIREEYPESLGYGVVAVFAVAGLYRCLRDITGSQLLSRIRAVRWRQVLIAFAKNVSFLAPAFVILFAPLVLSHALTWQDYGPDWDGYLISASYLADHHTFTDLMREFTAATGGNEWWNSKVWAWSLPDLRTLTAVDFVLGALRFGHAVLSILLMKIFHVPLWLAFYCLCVYSFIAIPLVIADAGLRRRMPYGLLVAGILIVTGSQNYILMMYEGMNASLLVMPIMLFFILNWRDVLLEQKTLGQKIFLAIILSGLITTFGEGIQIFCVVLVICLAVAWFTGKENKHSAKTHVIDVLQIVGLTVLVGPTFVIDFILWTGRRVLEEFHGGALHGPWSVLSLLFSIPSVTIHWTERPFQIIASGYFPRILEVCAVIAVGFFAWRRRGPLATDLLVVGLVMLVFCVLGNTYAIWKVALILQPLAVLTVLCLLPERVFAVRVSALVLAYGGIVSVFSLSLISLYWHITQPMHPEQFAIDRHLTNGQSVAIVTPSINRVYMRLGATGEDFWSNMPGRYGGAQADFRIGHHETLPLALYFDCDAEGALRCAAIKRKVGTSVPERTLVPEKVEISPFLRADGSVDQGKLGVYVVDQFGVPAQ